MLSSRAHLSAVSVIIDILGQENRRTVARSERLELFQHAEKFRGYLREVNFRVHIYDRGGHHTRNVLTYILFNTSGKLRKILLAHGKAGSIDMSAVIFQKVGAAADGLIQVESTDASGRACHETIGIGKDESRFIISLHKTGSDDTHHALVPVRTIDDDGIF